VKIVGPGDPKSVAVEAIPEPKEEAAAEQTVVTPSVGARAARKLSGPARETEQTRSLRRDAAVKAALDWLRRLTRQLESASVEDGLAIAHMTHSIENAAVAFRTAIQKSDLAEAKPALYGALARVLEPLRDYVLELKDLPLQGKKLKPLIRKLDTAYARLLAPASIFARPELEPVQAGEFLPINDAVEVVKAAYEKFLAAREKLAAKGRELSPGAEASMFRAILTTDHRGVITSLDAGVFDFLPLHLAKAITRDHHGPHADPANPEVSTTMLLANEIERMRKLDLPETEMIARLEHEFRSVSTNNLGDAIFALMMTRHLPELVKTGGLEVATKKNTKTLLTLDMIKRLAHFEDFGFFGSANLSEGKKRSGPEQVFLRDLMHLVLANFHVFDRLLQKHGVKGSDRIDGLPPGKQRDIVEAAVRGIEENLANYDKRLDRAESFKAEVEELKAEIGRAHDQMRSYLVEHGVSGQDVATLDSRIFYFFDPMKGGRFASWDAPSLVHKSKIQWQMFPFPTTDGPTRWGFVLAVPSERSPTFLDGPMTKIFGPRLPNAITRGDTLMFVFDPAKADVRPEEMAKILAEELRAHEVPEAVEVAPAKKPYRGLIAENVISHDAYLYDDRGNYSWTKDRLAAAREHAMAAFEEALKDPECKQVVLVVGLPGSGKTRWIHDHNSSDTVYYDSTLTSPEDRAILLRMAAKARKGSTVVFMETPLEACLRRNAERPADRRVPEDEIKRMDAALRVHRPRPEDVGFEKMLTVRWKGER
jgi:hypothetical protein